MGLKTTYKATRGDRDRLARDVRPGDKLYVVEDIARNVARYEDAQLYSTWIVAKNRAWATGNPTVYPSCSQDGHGTQTVQQLLASHREVHTEPPAGLRDMSHTRQVVTDKQVATYATRVHEADAAEDRRNRRQPVAAGKKRGWF